MTSKLFQRNDSLVQEMAAFQALMREDADAGRGVMLLGEVVIENARFGRLRKFIASATELAQTPRSPLVYFLTKALIAALVGSHLMVGSFILDNGYNLHDINLPNILNAVVKDTTVQDHIASNAVVFLHTRFAYELNLQENETYWTALHYAIQRRFLRTIITLLDFKVDINAVAKDDVMPLNVAMSLSEDDSTYTLAADDNETDNASRGEPLPTKAEIVELLVKRGAKETWRRGISRPNSTPAYSAIGAPRESSEISTKAPANIDSSVKSLATPTPTVTSAPRMVRFSGASLQNNNAVHHDSISSNVFHFSTSSGMDAAVLATAMADTRISSAQVTSHGGEVHATPTDNHHDVGARGETRSEETATALHHVRVSTATTEDGSNHSTSSSEAAISARALHDAEISSRGDVFMAESDDGQAFLFSTG